MRNETIIFESDTLISHYQVIDTLYNGRPARVLYSGNKLTAQSGVALDAENDLLFDYNQRLYELVSGVMPERALLIGGGACTLPTALAHDYPELLIDVVEIDPDLIDIAQQYFDFQPSKKVHVYVGDGLRYLADTDKKYDVILLDVFVNDATPVLFQSVPVATELLLCLTAGGTVAFNCIASYYGKRSAALERTVIALEAVFKTVEIFPADNGISLWIPQNFIITASNNNSSLAQHVRFQPVRNRG